MIFGEESAVNFRDNGEFSIFQQSFQSLYGTVIQTEIVRSYFNWFDELWSCKAVKIRKIHWTSSVISLFELKMDLWTGNRCVAELVTTICKNKFCFVKAFRSKFEFFSVISTGITKKISFSKMEKSTEKTSNVNYELLE